jgi:hypothetical protein
MKLKEDVIGQRRRLAQAGVHEIRWSILDGVFG